MVPRNNTSNIDFTNIETGRERVTYVDDTGITAITTVIIDLQDASGNVLCSSFVELNPATTTDIYIIENPPEPLNLNGYVVFYVYKNWIGNWNMNSEGCTLVARSNTDNIKISATGCSGGSLQMVSYVSAAGINTQTRVTIDLKSSSGDVLCAFTVVLNP
ncbi:hypothetical protein FACS1894166_09410 [Bacilli bacterium]|nr:hypothetical protein FACS1894166_09410 [Bacilli bacterium]